MTVYDTGVLVAADRGDRRAWEGHEQLLAAGIVPQVPAGALAQAWRGGPQPWLSRFLHGCDIIDLDETTARRAGHLCAVAGTSDVIDASVVVGAVARGAAVITADVADLSHLNGALGGPVEIAAL